jgi:hypothetical protein
MHRTILVLALLQVVAVDLGAPAVLRVSSHHVVLSASRQPPQGPPGPQRGVDAERLLGWLWQGRHTEVPSGPLDCSSCCSACTVLCTVVGPTVPEATTWPWARPSLQHHDESSPTPHTRCPDRQECGPHDDTQGPFTWRPACCSSSASQTSEVPGSLQVTGDRDRSSSTDRDLKTMKGASYTGAPLATESARLRCSLGTLASLNAIATRSESWGGGRLGTGGGGRWGHVHQSEPPLHPPKNHRRVRAVVPGQRAALELRRAK